MTVENSTTILLLLATALYTGSAAGYISYLFVQKDRIQTIAFILTIAGFSAHLPAVLIQAGVLKTLPVHNLEQTLIIAALSIAGVFIGMKFKFNLKILGIFAAPLIAATMIAALAIPSNEPLKTSVLNGFWLISHIILIFTGEAALALACGAGILYLLQEKAIKEKRRGFFFKRLPPLDLLDATSYSCIVTGFTLLTCGLITGLVYAKTIWGRFWGWDPKEIWSAVTWLVYAALLHGRLALGWRGKRSAVMTIIGFMILLFTFLGVNLLVGGHHQVFTK